jgi:predicted transposase/invertase (TIGR01784 family)
LTDQGEGFAIVQTDSLFYKLFQTSPSLLFELIGADIQSPSTYDFRSVELKQTAFRIDGVFLPDPSQSFAPVYVVEVQFQRDDQLYARLFAETMLFLRQNPTIKQWRIVVIFGDRSCEPTQPNAHHGLIQAGFVQQLYLDELAQTEGESIELALVRLIVESPENTMTQARQLVQRVLGANSTRSKSAIVELIETILIYKFPQMSWQEVAAMFGISEMKQTRVYQEGLEQGRTVEARSLILRQLHRRIGKLPDAMVEQVNQLSLDAVEALGEALLDFQNIGDLNQWLANASHPIKPE